MRFKYYLRGLGLGIIFTVLVLSLSGRLKTGEDSKGLDLDNANESQIDLENTTENNPYGYGKETVTETFYPAEDKLKDSEQSEGSEKTDESEKKDDESEGEAGTDNDGLSGDKKDSQSEQDKKSESDDTKKDTVKLVVKKGQYCWSVSEELEKLGVIDDAKEFRKFMDKKGFVNSIKSGTYHIPKKATFEEIAKILVK